MPAVQDPLWVVTTYFNPAGYARRRANFGAFRRALNAPLLAVELSAGGGFELTKDDADIVIQLVGDDALWQKERLINIGIGELPPHTEFVAWVDCDVIFEDPDWALKARHVLKQKGGLLQLFGTAIHLGRDIDPATVTREACRKSAPLFLERSIAPRLKNRECNFGGGIFQRTADKRVDHDPNAAPPAFGIAWSAVCAVIERVGLYDRNVVGGGDTVNLLSSEGDLISYRNNRSYLAQHPAAIRDRIERANAFGLFRDFNCLAQSVYHLWHGDMEHRKYRERHEILLAGRFDPLEDVAMAGNGTLKWRDPAGPVASAVRDYFFSRREDG